MTSPDPRRRRVAIAELLAGFADTAGLPPLAISGLGLDSRSAQPGDLFMAVAGHQRHGLQHAAEALRRGVGAILYDPAGGGRELAREIRGLPCIPVESLNQKVGFIADRFFDRPSQAIDVVAVTGTNGKTSCSHFLAHALGNQRQAAVIGTLGWGVPGRLVPGEQTTPDAVGVHAQLAALRAQGIRAVAIEASSHGLAQGRLNGVRTRAALYTNITRDHLDYHGTHEAYVAAKMRLLEANGLECVAFNADDPVTRGIGQHIAAPIAPVAFTLGGNLAAAPRTLVGTRLRQESSGLRLSVAFGEDHAELLAPVFGDFNAENVLGTLAVLLGLGYGLGEASERMALIRPVPGRMEHFASAGGVTAVVDYAHTPDALDRVLRSLKSHCRGALWVVFGCGGERDRGKRPLMGRAAQRWADHLVVTDDNPRREDGDSIVADILAGCSGGVVVERDRQAAIQRAIAAAQPGDVVLVAGKGHENTQDIGSMRIPFDDREVVRHLLSPGVSSG